MSLYKVVLIGESDVGKSSTYIRFRDGKWVDNIKSTVGLDQMTKDVSFKTDNDKEKTVQIQIWDTAGLERAGRMTNNYYKHSHAVLLMYDLGDLASLNRIRLWHEESIQYTPRDVTKFFIVGNKLDLKPDEIEVKDQQVAGLSDQLGIPDSQIFKISVKTGKNFDQMFEKIARVLTNLSDTGREKKEEKPDLTKIIEDDKNRRMICCQ